jgi:hypothetical protein
MRNYQWAITIAILGASPVIGGVVGGWGGLVGGAVFGTWVALKYVSAAFGARPRDV